MTPPDILTVLCALIAGLLGLAFWHRCRRRRPERWCAKPEEVRRLGWVQDKDDERDWPFEPDKRMLARLPETWDLTMLWQWPMAWNQGDMNSCTGHTVAAALQFKLVQAGKQKPEDADRPESIPSRMFIWRQARWLEGNVYEDAGASVRDALKGVIDKGFPFEHDWPHNPQKFKRSAPHEVWGRAWHHKVAAYYRIDNRHLRHIKAAVAGGDPVMFGCWIHRSFLAIGKDGVVPMPGWAWKDPMVGGHSMVIVGYDDHKMIGCHRGAFKIRNSWGVGWGDQGYAWMPYEYLTNRKMATDFWVIDFAK